MGFGLAKAESRSATLPDMGAGKNTQFVMILAVISVQAKVSFLVMIVSR